MEDDNGNYIKKFCRSRYLIFLYLPLIFLLLVSCTLFSPQKTPLDEVKLQLKWTHQAQFAGFYMAQDRGYYEQENIRVLFQEGGQYINSTRQVADREADFGVLSPEAILEARCKGEPLVAIAAIYRRSAVVFVAMADSGIVKPADMIGRTIALTNEQGAIVDLELQFYAMMNKLGLDYSQCNIVNHDPTYETFYQGKTDVSVAYSTAGLIKIRQKGYKVNLIWPSDYGIHFYSDTLAATDEMVRDKPELVTRFLRASLKGWQDAIDDYQQAVEVTMKYVSIPDEKLQTAMMEAQLPLVHTGEDHIGWMEPAIWDGMYQTLLKQDLLAAPFDVKDAYSMEFLHKIYGAGKQ